MKRYDERNGQFCNNDWITIIANLWREWECRLKSRCAINRE